MLRGCFTQSFTGFFLKWIVLREMHRGGCFFCFRFVAQSFTEFYTEFHGVFFEVDGVERVAWSPKLWTLRLSGFQFLVPSFYFF